MATGKESVSGAVDLSTGSSRAFKITFLPSTGLAITDRYRPLYRGSHTDRLFRNRRATTTTLFYTCATAGARLSLRAVALYFSPSSGPRVSPPWKREGKRDDEG